MQAKFVKAFLSVCVLATIAGSSVYSASAEPSATSTTIASTVVVPTTTEAVPAPTTVVPSTPSPGVATPEVTAPAPDEPKAYTPEQTALIALYQAVAQQQFYAAINAIFVAGRADAYLSASHKTRECFKDIESRSVGLYNAHGVHRIRTRSGRSVVVHYYGAYQYDDSTLKAMIALTEAVLQIDVPNVAHATQLSPYFQDLVTSAAIFNADYHPWAWKNCYAKRNQPSYANPQQIAATFKAQNAVAA